MFKQLERLRDIEDARIKVVYYAFDVITRNYGPTSMHDKDIIIKLDDSLITVTDHAEGIPLQVALNSLLIPSSSTKTIRRARH